MMMSDEERIGLYLTKRPSTESYDGDDAFVLPWETLEAVIQGKSPIDLGRMQIKTREEAFDLVYHYGYDLDHAEDWAEVTALFHEAVAFIEHRFLQTDIDWHALGEPASPGREVPPDIKKLTDLTELILMASQDAKPQRYWACAILKVLHTLVHIHNNPTLKYFQQASDSIVSNFHKLLLPMEDGTFCLTNRYGRHLSLYGFEAKHKKPRESILIKLLCKKENVAEDVWDLVGVRLITHHPADALLAIDILREQKVLLFSNIVPSRSRNTLLNFEDFRTHYEKTLADMKRGKKHYDDLLALLRSIPVKPAESEDFKQNPSTSPDYRSMHITCRHFLRLRVDDELFDLDGSELNRTPHPHLQNDVRLAFPYEIQITDKDSYLESSLGKSAHSLYKQRQVAAARRRVLGKLLIQH